MAGLGVLQGLDRAERAETAVNEVEEVPDGGTEVLSDGGGRLGEALKAAQVPIP